MDTSGQRGDGGPDPAGPASGAGPVTPAPGPGPAHPGGGEAAGGATVRRWMPAVLGVVGGTAVVAVGATGVGLLLPPADLDGRWLRVVRILGALAAVAGVVALLVQRRRLHPPGSRGPDPTVAALLAATTIMGVLALLALFAPVGVVEDPATPGGAPTAPGASTINPEATSTGPPPPPSRTAPVTEGAAEGEDREEPDWRVTDPAGGAGPGSPGEGLGGSLLGRLGDVLLLALRLALAVVGFFALRGRSTRGRTVSPPGGPVAAADAEAGLEASTGEIAREGRDAREQITAAYRRLLAALAAAGVPREPQEAPHEHLRRALGPLGVRAGPMRRLTELYVVAQFSEHPVTEAHRTAAAEALEASLASLRPTRTAPGGREEGTFAEGAPA